MADNPLILLDETGNEVVRQNGSEEFKPVVRLNPADFLKDIVSSARMWKDAVVLSLINGGIHDAVRQNEKRAAKFSVFCTDEVVKNINGRPEEQDIYFIVQVKRNRWEALQLHKAGKAILGGDGKPVS